MGRPENNITPKRNISEEKLRATPFQSVAELDAETKAIRTAVWRKFAEAKIVRELLTKSEYAFVIEEWKSGLIAFYGTKTPERVCKIFSEGSGLKLEINKEFTQTLGEHELPFVESIIRAGIESFGILYMRTKGLLRDPDGFNEALNAQGAPRAKRKTAKQAPPKPRGGT